MTARIVARGVATLVLTAGLGLAGSRAVDAAELDILAGGGVRSHDSAEHTHTRNAERALQRRGSAPSRNARG